MRKAFAALGVAAFTIVVPATRAEAANTTIHLVDNAPRPDQAQVLVNEGDTVTFANDDDVAHAIFAGGAMQGEPIPAHTVSGPYGPFRTGGQGGRFDYQVDEGGAAGVVIVPATSTEPPPTEPPATEPPPSTEAPTTTEATTTSTTTTSTTTTTTATASTTTTTVASSSSSSSSSSSGKDSGSSSGLAVLGVALLVAGFGGMVIATARRRGP